MDLPVLVSIRLIPECWRFFDEARSWPALITPLASSGMRPRHPSLASIGVTSIPEASVRQRIASYEDAGNGRVVQVRDESSALAMQSEVDLVIVRWSALK